MYNGKCILRSNSKTSFNKNVKIYTYFTYLFCLRVLGRSQCPCCCQILKGEDILVNEIMCKQLQQLNTEHDKRCTCE